MLAVVAVVGLVGLAGAALVVQRLRAFEPTEQPRIVFPPFVPPDDAPVIEPAPVPVVDLVDEYTFEPLQIGGGGYVTGLEIHSSGVKVARTDVGGAFLYDEAASRWEPLLVLDRVADPVPSDHQVESVAIAPSDPDRIYLAVGENFTDPGGRVLVSDDGGASFTAGEQRFAIAGNAEWRTGGERLSVDPTDADVVWLGTRTEGLWRSVDGGGTFAAVEGLPDGTAWRPDLNPTGITFVVASEGAVHVGVAGSGVWRSTDDGASWTQLWASTGLPYDAEIDAAGRLWVAEPDDERVQRFDPATGEVVTLRPSGGREYAAVATDPADASLVVIGPREVADGRSMWRSTDGGESWDTVGVDVACPQEWLETYGSGFLSVASMEFDPVVTDRLWFPEGFGVWRADGARDGDLAFECDTLGIEELVATDIVAAVVGQPGQLVVGPGVLRSSARWADRRGAWCPRRGSTRPGRSRPRRLHLGGCGASSAITGSAVRTTATPTGPAIPTTEAPRGSGSAPSTAITPATCASATWRCRPPTPTSWSGSRPSIGRCTAPSTAATAGRR